jgi:hypothetical protein
VVQHAMTAVAKQARVGATKKLRTRFERDMGGEG